MEFKITGVDKPKEPQYPPYRDKPEKPQTAEDVLAHFGGSPQTLPDGLLKYINEKLFAGRHWLLFEKAGETKAFCTRCGKESDLGAAYSHKSMAYCPSCSEMLEVAHLSRKKNIISDGVCYFFSRSPIQPETLTARCFAIRRHFSKDGAELKIDADSCTVFVYGKGDTSIRRHYSGKLWNYCEDWAGYGCFKALDWVKTERISSRMGIYESKCYWSTTPSVSIGIDTDGLLQAADGTSFRYALNACEYGWINQTVEGHVFRLLDLIARYPAAEYLIKLGMKHIVGLQATGGNTFYAIKWGKNRIKDILRFKPTPAELELMKRENIELVEIVARQQFAKTFGDRIELGAIRQMKLWEKGTVDVICRYLKRFQSPVLKLQSYLVKQTKENFKPSVGDYRDYLAEADELGFDMASKMTLFPRDLQKEHGKLSKRLAKLRERKRKQEEREKARREKEAYKSLYGELAAKYSYESGGLAVVVPADLSDLAAEGKKQHICVGMYASRVAEGSTVIVFIRKAADLNKSFVTMEICKEKIIQTRGYANRTPDAAVMKFVDEFDANVLAPLRAAGNKKRARARIKVAA